MSTFTLSVRVLGQATSLTEYGILCLLAVFPGAMLSTKIGDIIDRYKVKNVFMWSNCVLAVGSAIIFYLIYYETLPKAVIYLAAVVFSILNACVYIGFSHAIPGMVKEEKLSVVNGLGMVANALNAIIVPALCGFILGVLLYDDYSVLAICVTLHISGLLLALVSTSVSSDPSHNNQFGNILTLAFHFHRQRPKFTLMILLCAMLNFALGTFQAIVTPLVLRSYGVDTLGLILSLASTGAICGSILVTVKKNLNVRICMQAPPLLVGLMLIIMGIYPTQSVIMVCSFILVGSIPLTLTSSLTHYQKHVDHNILGKILGFRRMFVASALSLALLLGPLLVDYLITPFTPQYCDANFLLPVIGQCEAIMPFRLVCIVFGIMLIWVMLGIRKEIVRHFN